jgi:hypothetical protein
LEALVATRPDNKDADGLTTLSFFDTLFGPVEVVALASD